MQSNRGTKRHCGQCGANFYDLGRSPVVCPKCHADYVSGPRVAPRPPARAARVPEPTPREEEEAATELDPFAEDEVLSDDVEGEVLHDDDVGREDLHGREGEGDDDVFRE